MIYAFLIHSAESVGSVFFSHFYTGEGNDQARTSRQQLIVRKVIEDKSFQQHSVSYFPTALDMRVLSQASLNSLTTRKKVSEGYTGTLDGQELYPPMDGVVMLPASGLFERGLVAVWKQHGGIMFTIVCDCRDNFTLVANTCVLIVEQVSRKFGTGKLDRRITDEPDEVELIITPFFRQGDPLVVNHSLHRFMIGHEGDHRPLVD